MVDQELMELAGKLTEAQRRYMLAAECGWSGNEMLWVGPPTNTAAVLHRLGLWRSDGYLTPLGLRLREYLASMEGSNQ